MSKNRNSLLLNEAQLKCLIGPRTRDVFDVLRLQGEKSASEIQEKLGFESKSVYYQVKKLLEADLIVATPSDGRRATYYRIAVDAAKLSDEIQGVEFEDLAAKSIAAQLRKADRLFAAAAKKSRTDPTVADFTFTHSTRIEISPQEFKIFRQRYRELIDELRSSPIEGDAVGIHALFLLVPEPQTTKAKKRA